MVAKIFLGKSIRGLISYNEDKVGKGEARLIGGGNLTFGKHYHQLSYEEKLGAFGQIIARKKNQSFHNTVFHACLSLDPAEKPADGLLKEIACRYLQDMGYKDQPYLIYRHEDTITPHVHIVSTSVNREGRKISNAFSKHKSERIRKRIEQAYGLVMAQGGIKNKKGLSPLKKVDYGKEPTMQAIGNVIEGVLKEYKVTGFKEFSGILAGYNVRAAHIWGVGKKGYYEGMVYWATDDMGKRKGRPIKASSFYAKPTLSRLQKVFDKNREEKKEIATGIVKAIEKVFAGHKSINKEGLQKKLQAAGIQLVYPEGNHGLLEITVIDNQHKAVFKGSELGKGYSWNVLQWRLSDKNEEKSTIGLELKEKIHKAHSTLATIFDKLRKDEKAGEYFESRLIRKLPLLDLVTPLWQGMPELRKKEAEEAVKGYTMYKNGKLGEIEGKERALFNRGVESALRFLHQTPDGKATPEKKLEFLNKQGYLLLKEGDKLYIGHSKGSHLKWETDGGMLKGHFGTGAGLANKEVTLYNKMEKAFIHGMREGVAEVGDLHLLAFNYRGFKPLLSEENEKRVATHLTRSYMGEVLRRLSANPATDINSKESRGRLLAGELEKRGLQIRPVVEGGKVSNYRLSYYSMPEGAITVSVRLGDKLLSEGYNKEPKEVSTQYQMLVSLHQSLDRGKESAIGKTLDTLQKQNPVFAKELREELQPQINMRGKPDEKAIRAMLTHLIERVGAYPTDSLQERALGVDKDLFQKQANGYGAGGEEKEQTRHTLGDALAGNEDTSGVDSHHSRNRKRGLRLR